MQPQWGATGVPRVQTDQRNPNTAAVVIAWTLTVFTLGYFLPWAIAATRGKSNQAGVGIVNLLVGWTVIGWIVALVMACGAHQTVGFAPSVIVAQQFQATPPGWYPGPNGAVQYWDGARWAGPQQF
jgi:hypothetical protein